MPQWPYQTPDFNPNARGQNSSGPMWPSAPEDDQTTDGMILNLPKWAQDAYRVRRMRFPVGTRSSP